MQTAHERISAIWAAARGEVNPHPPSSSSSSPNVNVNALPPVTLSTSTSNSTSADTHQSVGGPSKRSSSHRRHVSFTQHQSQLQPRPPPTGQLHSHQQPQAENDSNRHEIQTDPQPAMHSTPTFTSAASPSRIPVPPPSHRARRHQLTRSPEASGEMDPSLRATSVTRSPSLAASPLPPPFPLPATVGGSGAASSSLREQIAVALHELESIKSSHGTRFRPNTAAPGLGNGSTNRNTTPRGRSGSLSARDGDRDRALPRPRLSGVGVDLSQKHLSSAAAVANIRLTEELRVAKAMVRKLYKRNITLTQEIKSLRGNALSQTNGNDDDGEDGAGNSLTRRRGTGGSLDDGVTSDMGIDTIRQLKDLLGGDLTGEGGEKKEDSDDAAPLTSASYRSPRRISGHAHARSPSTWSIFSGSGGGSGGGLGSSSHLLLLLGERDTTINRLQSQLRALTRKLHVSNAQRSLRGSSQTIGAKRMDVSASGPYSAAAIPLSPASPITPSSSSSVPTSVPLPSAPFPSAISAAHLHALRSSLASKLRAHISDVLVACQASGQPVSPKLLALMEDMQRMMIWEMTQRNIEKSNMQMAGANMEEQARESWVRSRLLESELEELQQKYDALDARARTTDTKLAAALDRTRVLEQECMRLKRTIAPSPDT